MAAINLTEYIVLLMSFKALNGFTLLHLTDPLKHKVQSILGSSLSRGRLGVSSQDQSQVSQWKMSFLHCPHTPENVRNAGSIGA